MEKKTNFIHLLLATLLIIIFSSWFFPKKSLKFKVLEPVKSSPLSRFDLSPLKGEVKLVIAGDVMLGRSVLTKADKSGDYSYPFKNIAETFKSGDIVFVNLEAPFFDNCPRTDSGMIFCTDYKMAEGLVAAGVDVVSLSNNHITNYGQEGITQTKKLLDEKAISWTGLGKLVKKEVQGVSFGFLGFDFTSKALSDMDLKLIADSNLMVDILVVGVHWGEEYRSNPSDNQRNWAKEMVAAGADVIAGHHPHWVQEIEYIEGKPVFFSLGNLIFDQMWSENTKKGEVAQITFENKNIKSIKTYQIYIGELGQPQIIE